jgi:hypothetical protein
MKKINYIKIFSFLCLSIAYLGCQDAIEIEQDGFLGPDNAYNTVEDLQSGLNGVYARYLPDSGGNGTGGEIYHSSVFTDEIKSGIASNGQGSQLYDFIIDNTNTGSASYIVWQDNYRMIARANRVLEAFNSVPISTTELPIANHIQGQLLGLRALGHMKLLEYFAPEYESSGLGVINLDFVNDVNDQLARNTFGETMALIKSDLIMASTLLDPGQNSNIFINTDVVKAIRTRVALLEQDYTTALTLSSQLVADYPLASQAQYLAMYQDTDDTELIFKLSRVSGDTDVALLYYFNFISATDGYLEVSNQLFNELSTVPNDIRIAAVVNGTFSTINGVDDPTNVLVLNKYPGSADGQATNDIKIFRSSEFWLIKAETEARTGNLIAAGNSIKAVRDARFGSATTAPTYANLTAALTDILSERRKELCFEGHRYLDLKRLGRELGIGIDRNPVDCASFQANCTLASTDSRFTLPIPQAEIDANANIQLNPSN